LIRLSPAAYLAYPLYRSLFQTLLCEQCSLPYALTNLPPLPQKCFEHLSPLVSIIYCNRLGPFFFSALCDAGKWVQVLRAQCCKFVRREPKVLVVL
ncbi:hypothetical protein Zm00014a_042090, partial [Zea mays]